MAVPQFIVDLRQHIGHAPLWLSGVTSVVTRGDDVLLVRVKESDRWTLVTGIIDPGEQPADTAIREVAEEAGVTCRVSHLAGISVSDMITHASGDQAQYLNYTFACEWVSGEPTPDADETVDAGWFPRDALPEPMHPVHVGRLATGLADSTACEFTVGDVTHRPRG